MLLEAAGALIFFGALMHDAALLGSGNDALQELAARGYLLNADDPLRVYPADTGGNMSGAHAGGWRPGVISLRENPQGNTPVQVILRHELAHEATYRTCGVKLPIWAEEAAAMAFSGEIQLDQTLLDPPDEAALVTLKKRIKNGSYLDHESYRTLAKLVAGEGWPVNPCSISTTIERQLNLATPPDDRGLSAILLHLASGRTLEAKGDQKNQYPPGSLLKIPYVAALTDTASSMLGEELAKSDTQGLLQRKDKLDIDRYRFFLSPVKDAPLGQPLALEEKGMKSEQFWRKYLGERGTNGYFPFEANLQELAQVLRGCLLFRPEPFFGLAQNGFIAGSTLFAQSEADRQVLANLQALAKTGTVADARNKPMIGHLMVAWPAEKPVFLAVFRGFGIAGSAVLSQAAPLLREWSSRHPVEYANVRVRLMSLTTRESWQIVDESPFFERQNADGSKLRVSIGGRSIIVSSARKSRSERQVAGIIESSADGQNAVLETDTATYSEAVLSAEADDLPLEARKAMVAVIAWNGVHGGHRHPESNSLCDSTHCMVFLGASEKKPAKKPIPIDPKLLALLEDVADTNGLTWLAFSKGGDEKWTKRILAAELQMLVKEPRIVDLRRERTRTGEVMIHLIYPENEEVVSCEMFRNSLKLLSCPDGMSLDKTGGSWIFSGIGEGHSEGLSMERARVLADSGRSAAVILSDAYGKQPNMSSSTGK
jgi:peptidoglycan hydrolase-like amidase